jgi:hypothetical protein
MSQQAGYCITTETRMKFDRERSENSTYLSQDLGNKYILMCRDNAWSHMTQHYSIKQLESH